MVKIAHYAADGRVLGFYDSKIHQIVPVPNTAVSDDEWQSTLLEPQEHRVDLATRKLVRVGPALAVVAGRRIAVLQLARDEVLAGGLAYTMPDGTSDIVQIRDRDTANLAALNARAASLDGPMRFRAGSNRVYVLSPAEMLDLTRAALNAREAILTRFWERKAAVEAATSAAAIGAVTWA